MGREVFFSDFFFSSDKAMSELTFEHKIIQCYFLVHEKS